MGSLAIIWKANRNCTRGTPVRRPPGPRLGDSWWGRGETPGLGGLAEALATAAQPIARMLNPLSLSVCLSPPFPFLSTPLPPSQPPTHPQHSAAKTECGGVGGGGRKISCCYGDGRQRRSRAVCWAGVEERGRGGVLSVSLETIFCRGGGCTCKSSGNEACASLRKNK